MTQLLLVYNADTNLWSRIVDFLTKMLRPTRYPCRLCMLTFGWFTMISRWRRYLSRRPEDVVELHRNEFRARFGEQPELPAIFLLSGNELTQVLNADEINSTKTLGDLMEHLDRRLP